MFKKSTITLLFLIMGPLALAQHGPKLKFDEPDDVFWDNRFGDYGTDGPILDIEYVNEDTLFIAGNFNVINGYHAHGIALWDGETWSEVPNGNDNITSTATNSNNHGRVTDIEYVNGKLYFLSIGRFANFNASTDGVLKSYDFNTDRFEVYDESYVNTIVDLEATDSGVLYLMTASRSNEENLSYNIGLYYYAEIYGDFVLSAPMYSFLNDENIPSMKPANEGVILFDLNAESINSSTNSLSNPQIVYTTNKYEDGVTDFGVDSVYDQVNDVDEIVDGVLFTGISKDVRCYDCAISKFSFGDSTWSNSYFFDAGFTPPVRIVGQDERNFSFLRPGYLNNYFLNTVEDGTYRDNDANFELQERFANIPLNDMVQVGDSVIFGFWGSEINAAQPIQGIGLIHNGVEQFAKNPNSLGVNGEVLTMLEMGNKLFVGGEIKSSGDQYLQGLGIFENDTWTRIGSFKGGFPETRVNTLTTLDKYVFVGGSFEEVETENGPFYVNNLALYDTSDGSWSSLGELDGYAIIDLEKIGNAIYAVTYDQAEFTRKLMRYLNGSWSEVRFNKSPYSIEGLYPIDIISQGNRLYISGLTKISEAGSNEDTHTVVAIDDTGFYPIKLPFNVSYTSAPAVSKIDDSIILSTLKQYDDFNEDGMVEEYGLYKIMGDTVQTFLPSPSNTMVQLIGSNDRLFAFNARESGGAGFNGIATWDGESWKNLGSGIKWTGLYGHRLNTALITQDGKLAIGGKFSFAGNKPASNFTFWSGETAPSTPQTISFKNNPVIEYTETLTFQWSNANLSSSFEFELSEVSDFSNIMIGLSGIAENEVKVRADFQAGSVYYWRVRAVNPNGYSAWSDVATFEIAATVSTENSDVIHEFALLQNYPNPFNPSTTIQFSLPESRSVHLSVFDISGRKVATLFNGDRLSAGVHNTTFKADHLSSGLYFYRLEAGGSIQIKKMLLIK